MRGEDKAEEKFILEGRETPPRAWGRHAMHESTGKGPGNTPTCVGKTLYAPASCRCGEKHPHVRGEDSSDKWYRISAVETPPRAWGRPKGPISSGINFGNTPTCVGKTCVHDRRRSYFKKHPHVRGEDFTAFALVSATMETPPRAWGRLPPALSKKNYIRNTPTCVGKTLLPSFGLPIIGKHPHVRGEDFLRIPVQAHAMETPPRAWGRH